MSENIDQRVVADFGEEWDKFHDFSQQEISDIFAQYFSLVDFAALKKNAIALDVGCGSGRWAELVADHVGQLHCVDASKKALAVAKEKLAGKSNCTLHLASVDAMPIEDESMDFVYSLGVLHHVPDTQAAIRDCVSKLKKGAPFLIYLYYRFDNKPLWFKGVWCLSDWLRKGISRLPGGMKRGVAFLIACALYWPLARISGLLDKLGVQTKNLPLSYYKDRSFFVMKNDAVDRFCTRLEQRFTQSEIRDMLAAAGLHNIQFRNGEPYWVAIGYKS